MGYEEPIPPKPTRQQEVKMLDDLQADWLNQSNFKWYNNEAERKTKLDLSSRINTVRINWWQNFFIGAVLTAPLFVIPMGRYWFRTSSGVPMFFRPKFVYTSKPEYLQTRNWTAMKKQVPAWIVLSATYAYWFTPYEILDDERLTGNRVVKML